MAIESEDLTTVQEAHQKIFDALTRLPAKMRRRVIDSVLVLLGENDSKPLSVSNAPNETSRFPVVAWPKLAPGDFSEDRTTSPKAFIVEKKPRTDVERVACLAYYLTHYRDTPFFKTVDISNLNTEAAQLKLSNPSYAVENAAKQGYLVSASKGQKQISAAGEVFVQALPDRDAGRQAMAEMKPRRLSRKRAKGPNS